MYGLNKLSCIFVHVKLNFFNRMNRIFVLLLGIMAFSCSYNNDYEKAIADYVQTDKSGTKYDLKFKVLEIKELQKITIADSINILTERMESERNKQIARQEESIRSNQEMLEKEQNGNFPLKTMIDFYTKSINDANKKIDELKSRDPGWLIPYENRPKDEILAILVQCKYSVVPPTYNTTIEEAKDFVLTTDGKKCKGIRSK